MTGTPGTDLVFINEEFFAEAASPEQMDLFLAEAWRHFGTHFFRYSLGMHGGEIRRVVPLRIRLSEFLPSKSQSRVLRKNADLRTEIRPIKLTSPVEELFDRHRLRFKQGRPDSLRDFLSSKPANTPCEGLELAVYDRDRLLATSFFDVGNSALSGIYAVFDPDESHRSLGIFTMLKEIEFAIEGGWQFYYQGYCYSGESFYDYKKRFRGTEGFDWNGQWECLEFKL